MESVTISVVGDVMVGGILSSNIEKYKEIFLSKEILEILNSADIRFCNLESPLSKLEEPPEPDKTLLHAKEESIEFIKKAGFNIVSLANNHSMDFGWMSLKRTIDLLKENNIKYIGAGKNLQEAREPVFFDISQMKIAFLAYTWTPPLFEEGSKAATDSSPGVSPYNLKYMRNDIEKIRNNVDIIIISMHWGEEFTHYPTPKVVSDAHSIIDMGADIILGSHPHVLQGYESYHKGLIFYSLSNFLFSPWFGVNDGRWINYKEEGKIRRWYRESREGVVLKFKFNEDKYFDYIIIPTIQDKKKPFVRIPPQKDKNKILKQIKKWSSEYSNRYYSKNHQILIEKERRFNFFKVIKNEIDTYGWVGTFKKGWNKFLRLIK